MAGIPFTEGSTSPPSIAGGPNQLLVNIIDGRAHTQPESLYAIIPNSFTTYSEGFRKVSYSQLASAINGAAAILSNELPPTGKSEVLAYVGPNDIGYVVLILAAVKAGHKLLLLSPRNTKSDHASLFENTNCTTLLTLPPPYSPTINTILEAVEPKPRVIHVPTIFQLLETPHPHFPYPKTFESAKNEALVLVHTSGTTSTPKLVTYTHGFAAAYARSITEPPPEGHMNLTTLFQGCRAFTTFPFFHAGAIQLSMLNAIPNQTIMVCSLAAVPPSAQGIVDALKHVDVEVVNMVAPFMEQMAKSPEMLEFVLPRVRGVTFGGADVSSAAANAFLESGVNVAGFNGSTETAPYPLIRPKESWEPEDLKYIQPHPVCGMQFQPTENPELYEAVIVRNSDPQKIQPVFHIFPDLQEFRTRDLFSPHPTKEGLWLYRGRADDMIISAAGELCNPIPFEQGLSRLPQVKYCIMIGTGRYQKALLIEPAEPVADREFEAFLDAIWGTVEVCNQGYPEVNRIKRDHVMITQPDMPLKRAGKGTVQRAPTLEMYKERIERLYEVASDGVAQNAEPYLIHMEGREMAGSG